MDRVPIREITEHEVNDIVGLAAREPKFNSLIKLLDKSREQAVDTWVRGASDEESHRNQGICQFIDELMGHFNKNQT